VEQNCVLLETGGKRVLFDNGLGSERLYGPDSGQLLASLAEAAIDPASIDAMVLTHAHSDHCWGTMADDGTPNFPNATIYIAQEELDFWTSNPPGQRRERSIAGVKKHLLPVRDRIQFIRDGEEFLPGVQAVATPGHTPGHMAFLFDGGWCLTGDVAFHDPLSYAFPEAESVFDVDPQLGVVTRQRLLQRLVAEQLRVIGYHHPWPGLGQVERVAGRYRFAADA
jgi:glyoxylase-like metal-dependent hydrolase (beta-lactamase superfamily II)